MRYPILLLLTGLLLQACVSTPPDPAEQILGSWESKIGDFTVVTTYSEAGVHIDDHAPLPYEFDADRIIIDGDTTSARLVSFPSSDEMVQTDALTGTEHRYQRR